MGFNGGFGGGQRRGGFGGGRRSFGGPREMHKIKCSECGKDAEVPFKPRNGTPVYCRECFFKRKGIEPRSGPAPKEQAAEESEDSIDSEEESEGSEDEY
jgi:DNA-directed RNA polymerase